MLTEDFCIKLEYYLCAVLEAAADPQLAGFWCDGVLLPAFEHEYSIKTVNDTRQIVTTAFIGKTGQDRYACTLHFGDKAMSRYARGLSLDICLPQPDDKEMFHVDPVNKTMDLQLL